MERPWLRHYEKGVPLNMGEPQMTLPKMLKESVQKFPDKIAMSLFKTEVSYRELDELSTNLAKNLVNSGLEKGDRVAIMAPNSPEFVIAFYGVLKAGGVAVPVNSLYKDSPENVAYILNDSEARIFVVFDTIYKLIETTLREMKINLGLVLETEIMQYLSPKKKREGIQENAWPVIRAIFKKKLKGGLDVKPVKFKEWIRGARPGTHLPKVNPEDIALLLYTSGTTGRPKGVMLTHKNLVVNTLQAAAWVKNTVEEGKDRILAVLPFFHAFGVTACMNTSIRIGATMVLLPKFSTEDAAAALTQGITIFPAVPAMLVALNKRCAEGKIAFKKDGLSLKVCISGADTLLPEVQEEFAKYTGTTPIEGFGQSETSPVTHVHPIKPIDGRVRRGSIGLPISGTDARIIDLETGKDLGPDREGELLVRGPQVMEGYWRKPEETAAVYKDGWLYTGDIVRMDKDGYFYVISRMNDMIKFKGEKIFPKEVEDVLLKHPKIEEVAVVGVPHRGLKQVVVAACIVLKNRGEKMTEEEIIAFCKTKNLAEYKVPKIVEFRLILPKNFMSKIDKRKLRETLTQKYAK